ncbi:MULTISPECIES: lytic transglycosylase domain-containing protein [unclassified Streptomyces]|uniref:lytic transglycosylase domain-containing protein n=1 Tax=unclassified Streptomyces TaxID=2593676 RepID=UPI00168B4ECF|nr:MULTISPECIES: lytic transglycosylase domain-containing protein [unclassified Streptomyces]MBD3003064.1 lytic transglycosylase domain-containing protein [Streptomyces sp. 5-10]
MLTRAAGMVAAFLAGLALIVAAVLVVRHLTEPSEPELPVIPDARRPVVESAARACSPLSVPLLAAQIDAESGWRRDADSGHAQGISQFSPVTWKEWGQDGDGDGKADVWEPRDAIPSQARYMCHLYEVVKAVPGSGTRLGSTRLALAAYNAGPNAVLRARGIPKILETREYVDKILKELLPKYQESEEKYQRSEGKHTGGASASPSAPASPSPSPSGDPSGPASGSSPAATRRP